MAKQPHIYPKGCAFSSLEDIAGKRITIMGLGLNGGGEASARFFLRHGAFVTVTDMKSERELRPTVENLVNDASVDKSRLAFHLGGHDIADFESADCVIKNPGVKIEGNRFLAAAKAVETDVSVFLSFTKAKIIAVTGSKGKSSTVSALHYGLKEAGFNAFLGGNITVSPLTFLEKTDETAIVVLELSSWQLADLRGRGVLKPRVALITKIVPDHQNWYGNMEDYVADKRLIYQDQNGSDYAIFDADGDDTGAGPKSGGAWGEVFAAEAKARVLRYSKAPLKEGLYGAWLETGGGQEGKVRLPADLSGADGGARAEERVLRSLLVPGIHLRQNVLNAALVMRVLGVPADKTASILSSWTGIEHRLQYFHCYRKRVRFYNDSCATVPEAAAAAARSFPDGAILIAGGTDKSLDFTPLADTLSGADGKSCVQSLYLLAGSGTDKLKTQLDARGIRYTGVYENLDSLLRSLKTELDADAALTANVVFSPGATSFGMFNNEFDRGRQFMTKVKALFTCRLP
ncbi:MAG: UDP-N-acetylmuramoyl-L-alanine--D-glutamate ligase [Treponema sp.]